MTNKILTTLLFSLMVSLLMGQADNRRYRLNATLEVGATQAGTTGAYRVFALVNDLNSEYAINNVQVGNLVWDAKCDVYVVVAINSTVGFLDADLDWVTSQQGDTPAGPTTGTGVIYSATSSLYYPLATTSMPSKLVACIENSRSIEIDEDIAAALAKRDTSLASFDMDIDSSRIVTGVPNSGAGGDEPNLSFSGFDVSFPSTGNFDVDADTVNIVATETATMSGSSSLVLATGATGSLQVKTPDVVGAAAQAGWYLSLSNATTGEVEFTEVVGGGGPSLVEAVDGNTINFTVTGDTSLTGEVILDPDGTNILTSSAAGLLAAIPIDPANTNLLSWSGSGLLADITLDPSALNILTNSASGLMAQHVIDPAGGNLISNSATGLLVTANSSDITLDGTIYGYTTTVTDVLNALATAAHVTDTTSTIEIITNAGSGAGVPDTLVFSVKVSPNAGNFLSALSNGLYVTADASMIDLKDPVLEINTTVQALFEAIGPTVHVHKDTPSIDATINTATGAGIPDTVQLDVKISADADNGLEERADGLYVTASPTVVHDTVYFLSAGEVAVRATGPGVTYSLSVNVGTLTIPDGVRLKYVRVNESTSDLSGNSDYVLRILDQNGDINQGTIATFVPPTTDFIKRDNLGNDPPTTTFAFQYTADNAPTPQVWVTGYTSGQVDIRFKNVDSFSEWTAIASF